MTTPASKWLLEDASSGSIARRTLFAILVSIGIANGFSERIANAVSKDGILLAFLGSFGISVVVWVAAILVVWKIAHESAEKPASAADMIVALLAGLCFLAPIPALSWLGLVAVSAYLFLSADTPAIRDGAALLAATTVPMFWAPAFIALFGDIILSVDAKMIGWVVGTGSTGNMVPFAAGTGILFIAPACSSFVNLSITVLLGILFMTAYGLNWTGRAIATIAMAAGATILVNVLRISAIAILPGYYSEIHGPLGSFAAEVATMILVLGIYLQSFRGAWREPIRQ